MPDTKRERTLSERERSLMEHALAWPKCYRNHFAADPHAGEGSAGAMCAFLTERGLMERGREISGGLVYYHVTDAGRAAITRATGGET